MTTLLLHPSWPDRRALASLSTKLHPALLQLVAISPVLWWFGKRLNDGSDEPLGLLTLALALILAWRDRKFLHAGNRERTCGAMLILVSVAGIHWLPPMIRAGLAMTGIATWYGIHRRAGLMGLLALSLPVAASLQFFAGYPLRVAAAEGTVRLLELCNIVAFREGTQIGLGGKIVGVDPACGGVRMLWHALAAGMALAAIHRLSWRATVIGGFLAIALVIPANTVRAAILAVIDSGRWPENLLGHSGIGLVSFAVILLPLWLAISSRSRPAWVAAAPSSDSLRRDAATTFILALSAALAPLLAFATPRTPGPPDFGQWPEEFTFQGVTLPLQPLAPTEEELAFSKSFPGTLSSHRWGDSQVILRRVDSATRRLHPSRDCLRAAGYETTNAITVSLADGSRWARFFATRDGIRLTVHERITSASNGSTWTDASAWYWSALRHPLNGPWQAETVISR